MTEMLCNASVLVYGSSKVGKSWLAASGPPPVLILDAEGGTRFLPFKKIQWTNTMSEPPEYDGSWEVCVVYVRDFSTLDNVYTWLHSGKHPFRTVVIDSISEAQQRCYLPGTEVLSADGWVKIEDLPQGVAVLAVDDYGAGRLEVPTSRQMFQHSGYMVDFGETQRSCRLVVTPDHRVPTVTRAGSFNVRRAEEVGDTSTIVNTPVTSTMNISGDADPWIQIAAAIQADGSIDSRTSSWRVQWTFRNKDKISRLELLLSKLGVEFNKTGPYGPYRSDWRFRVHYADVLPAFDYLTAEKTWAWNAVLSASLATRTSLLQELKHWDGSPTVSQLGGSQYNTKLRHNMDVIAAVAASSGWSCVVNMSGVRPGYTGHYRMSLQPRTHGRLNRGMLVPYDGPVYCLSVPSTFLIVRYRGVTTVSGNCVDAIAGQRQMTTPDWGNLLRRISGLVRGYRDLLIHPLNPVDCVVYTAMEKVSNEGVHSPYLQGAIAGTLSYYLDIVLYLRAAPDESGRLVRKALTKPHPQFLAGDRTDRLPTIVEDPTLTALLALACDLDAPLQEGAAFPDLAAEAAPDVPTPPTGGVGAPPESGQPGLFDDAAVDGSSD